MCSFISLLDSENVDIIFATELGWNVSRIKILIYLFGKEPVESVSLLYWSELIRFVTVQH